MMRGLPGPVSINELTVGVRIRHRVPTEAVISNDQRHRSHGAEPSGFGNRAALSAAWAWLDKLELASRAESIPTPESAGHVLADAIAVADIPTDSPRAAENGYAVRAADCDGASDYNPLTLTVSPLGSAALPAGSACPIATGWTIPAGSDAVLPLEAAQLIRPGMLEVLAPVAPNTGIQQHPHLHDGGSLYTRGHHIRPQDISCLVAMGIDSVAVLRRPRVALIVPGAKFGPDALTSLLQALLARDGALTRPMPLTLSDGAFTAALQGEAIVESDLVLLAGRSGIGLDDSAAGSIAQAGGTLAHHGIALRPGGSSGMGTLSRHPGHTATDTIPVILLPGDPLACLIAYDLLAARLVRRLAGAATILPYPARTFELTRKIVSGLGIVDVVPVTLSGSHATPVGTETGIGGMVPANGFVVVPEASEGHPQGARVRVHLYNATQSDREQDTW